jgi:hypothetical protein
MNNIKKLFIGLPLFNIFIIAVWWGMGSLEKYFRPVTENSAPISFVGFFVLLLILGGFAVCGIVFGIFKTIKYDYGWKDIAVQIILLTIIIDCMYIIFYFFSTKNHSAIIRDTSIITLEQISGYVVGCSLAKLINHRKKRA